MGTAFNGYYLRSGILYIAHADSYSGDANTANQLHEFIQEKNKTTEQISEPELVMAEGLAQVEVDEDAIAASNVTQMPKKQKAPAKKASKTKRAKRNPDDVVEAAE